MAKLNLLFYAAAATTAIAGIIHVVLGIPASNPNAQILFIVGGVAQIFGLFQWLENGELSGME